jgi:hypothetical protein
MYENPENKSGAYFKKHVCLLLTRIELSMGKHAWYGPLTDYNCLSQKSVTLGTVG